MVKYHNIYLLYINIYLNCIKYLGQLSLSRLNRLNTSMFWESCFNFNLKPYLSLKFSLFINYFTKFFFYYNFFTYDSVIHSTNYNLKISIVVYKKFSNLINYTDLIEEKSFFKKLKSYIYILKNNYYILYVYTNLNNYKDVLPPRKKYLPYNFSRKASLYL